jgi:cytochrome c peroxidase
MRFGNSSLARRFQVAVSWLSIVAISVAVPQTVVQGAEKHGKPKAGKSLDQQLRQLLNEQGIRPVDGGPPQDPAQVQLGQLLFFDRELSGNRDISCATCHHPFFGTGDGLSLPIGTGAVTPGMLGPFRELGPDRELVPRNAPELFNRGADEWFTQFWDSRVTDNGDAFVSPAGDALPPGLPNVLAVQAMFPVTSRDEMRGRSGDTDVFGDTNELALVGDDDLPAIWGGLMTRLLSIPEYAALFANAYPDVAPQDLGFEHAATAMAAFEADAYTFLDSPWDRYLSGDTRALSAAEKRGAILFYGQARCSSCHAGSLMTDQQHYNIGVPQLGPGKGAEAPLDHGRGRETGIADDLFRFRTPPLRNCEITGPYMHNGAYADLSDVVWHHAFPRYALLTYSPARHLDQLEVRDTYTLRNQFGVLLGIDDAELPRYLTRRQVGDLVRFLKSLTAPDIQRRMDRSIPDAVPSGLPVDGR